MAAKGRGMVEAKRGSRMKQDSDRIDRNQALPFRLRRVDSPSAKMEAAH